MRQNKRVYYGRGALKYFGHYLTNNGAKKILIVTSKKTYKRVFCDQVAPFIEGVQVTMFDDYEVNPNDQDLLRGLKISSELMPDIVVGLGGGSALDMAKLISLFGPNPAALTRQGLARENMNAPLTPFILLPTTAGTGSEATHFAVLYIQGKKFSIAHQDLRPKLTILDPNLVDMPLRLAASSGLDAMTQAIESIWSMQATRKSILYAKRSLSMIREALGPSVLNKDQRSIGLMCQAAHLSGKAIDVSKTTAPHALSYHLSTQYDVPHGIAVALNMLIFLGVNSDDSIEKYNHIMSADDIRYKNKIIYHALGVKSASEAQHLLYDYMVQFDLPTSYEQIGLTRQTQLEALVSDINQDRMKNNPFQLCQKDLLICLNNYNEQARREPVK